MFVCIYIYIYMYITCTDLSLLLLFTVSFQNFKKEKKVFAA